MKMVVAFGLFALCGSLFLGCAAESHPPRPVVDDGWSPTVATPAFPQGTGPVVVVDAAHGNWHTIDGRFRAFAELLTNDGYRLRSAESKVSSDSLAEADILVVANAVKGGADSEWILPTPPAFDDGETTAVVHWVENGGSLLLIADHMPFPGAVSNLADAFGVSFSMASPKSP